MNEAEKSLLALAEAVLSGEKPGSELVDRIDAQIREHGLRVVIHESCEDDPEILLHEADCARDRLYDAVARYNELREDGHGIVGAYYELQARHPDVPDLNEILDLRADLSRKER